MYTVSITSQGQVSIPVQLRRDFNLNLTSKAMLVATDDGILIRPAIDFLDLAGFLKTDKKPISSNQIHQIFEQNLAKNG